MAEPKDGEYCLNFSDGSFIFRMGTPHYYLFTSTPPGLPDVLYDLKMSPATFGEYDLRFLSVEDFLKDRGRPHPKLSKRYQSYTVQTFGLSACPRPGMKFSFPPPHPSQYKCEPMYWYRLGVLPVQIWRIRVFSCPLEKIKTSIHNPFGLFPPQTVYVEERWHPKAGVTRLIGGLGNAPNYGSVGLEQLYEDALGIMTGYIKRGRPRGTTYYTREQFSTDLKKHYRKVLKETKGGSRKPSRAAVALSLGIGISTLYRYMDKFNVHWPSR